MTKLTFAYLHEFEVSHSWHECIVDAMHHELGRGNQVRVLAQRGLNGLLGWSRNVAVQRFLQSGDDYLFWSDTDMGFASDAVEKLLAADASIIGGLYFGSSSGYPDGKGGYKMAMFPLVMDRNDEGLFLPRMDYERDTLFKADGTGSGFVLIHRRVFEEIGKDWYSPLEDDRMISEDLAFCWRAKEAGFTLLIDTRVKATHHKSVWLAEEMYNLPEADGE